MKLSSKDPSKKPIGELLVEAGLIRPEHIEEALQKQRREGGKMVEILIGLGRLQTNEFVRFLARQGGVPSIDLAHYEIPVQIIGLVQRDFVIKNEAIPIDKLGRLLTVAMVCPLDSDTIQELETMTQSKVKPLLCSPEAIRMAIQRYYPAPGMAGLFKRCLLYTSDAADDLLCVDLGCRRIIKKKKNADRIPHHVHITIDTPHITHTV